MSQGPYEQMKQRLVGFRAGTVRLGDLVEDLPALVKEVPDIDPTWRDRYVSYWWTLEQVHGDAIDLGEAQRMPSDTRSTVDDALDGLESLVDQALVS